MPVAEPTRHVVIFDCNVYLDVGRVLLAPFSWPKFNQTAARLRGVALPHPIDGGFDSLRAIAVSLSGRFAGDELLEVWSSSHINGMVRKKAMQSPVPDPETGLAGLGWTQAEAGDLVSGLVDHLVHESNGGVLDSNLTDGDPPLDHEDGMVFGACKRLASDDPLCHSYCVTRDRDFLKAHQTGQLSSHTKVLTPAKYVQLVRASRFSVSTKGLRPRSQ